MGVIKKYKLEVFVHKKRLIKNKYLTEDEGIIAMLNILQNSNLLDFSDKGEFKVTTTELFEGFFTKRYVIDISIPPMIIKLTKLTKGDYNKEAFLEKIKYYREKFDERN